MRPGLKRTLRVLAYAVGGLVLLMLVVPPFISLDGYKHLIEEQVRDLTGRDISLDGDISLRLLPRPGVVVEQVSLSNASGFGDEPMARVQRVRASVRWLPLITGSVQPTGVVVDGLDVGLVRNEQGASNWQDLLAMGGEGEPEAQPGAPSFAMGGVEIRGATILFDDHLSGIQYSVKSLDAELDGFRSGFTSDFRLACRYEMDSPGLRGAVSLSGGMLPDLAAIRFLVTDIDLAVEATGAALPEGRGDVTMRIKSVDLDMKSGSLDVGGFEAGVNGLRMTGSASAESIDIEPTGRARLEIPACDLRKTLRSLGLGMTTSDPAALGKVAGNFVVKYEGGILSVEPLVLIVDNSKAEGAATVDGPLTTFFLAVDRLNLDRYLPPPPAMGEEPAPEPEPASAAGLTDIASLVRALNIEGELRAGMLLISGMEVRDVTVKVTAKDGDLDLGPVEAVQ